MAINTTCRVRVHWRDVGVSCLLLAGTVMLLCCGTGTADGAPTGTFSKLFTFGDSYVDTGNRDRNNNTLTAIGLVNQPWLPPFGRTTPGIPAGHFSDGDVLSEVLGKHIGLHPATYLKYLSDSSTAIFDGMNFAVGGSGVFNNLGFTKTRDQIAQFKALVDANVYNSASVFSESVVLFAISGNDYAAFLRNFPDSGITPEFITSVVDQMVIDLKSLYDMGFRNFVISELEPLGCLPSLTAASGYTACLAPYNDVATAHNLYLNQEIAATFPPSTGANFILLDNQKSFSFFLTNPGKPGSLKPCCISEPGALCGDVDSNNNPRYTLCSSSSPSPFFFDEFHPSEAGWNKVFKLYITNPVFTHKKSLRAFLKMH